MNNFVIILAAIIGLLSASPSFSQPLVPTPPRWMGGEGPKKLSPYKTNQPFQIAPTGRMQSKAAFQGRICLLIDSKNYGGVSLVKQYQAALANQGFETLVYRFRGGTAEDVRNHLIKLYNQRDSLKGAVFFGPTPYALFEMYEDWGYGLQYTEFPCDLFLWIWRGSGWTKGCLRVSQLTTVSMMLGMDPTRFTFL